MPESSRRVAASVLMALSCLLLGAAATEETIFRQVKIDVFDQDWPGVLRGCEEILARFPSGPSAPQAAFYRADALAHLPGREGEALAAYRRFLSDHAKETVLVEEAWSNTFRLACEQKGHTAADCAALLRQGLRSGSAYVSTLAAIRAADVEDGDLRRAAMPILRKACGTETDPEIRSHALLAILKIDPKQVPSSEGPKASATPRPTGGKGPTLIRMTVYDKDTGRYDLKINLPIAFARLLLESLGEEQRRELRQEARQKGIDLDDIFQAIEKAGAGKLLEFEDEKGRVEIWIE
ncbi:MAG TPA: hypothetical protein VFT43_12215 [Candidatus Polarisedimenticolia bacterium]|nr:hypothetical protein [Candidatus Polarisedimenticolia bacterium]